MKTLHNPEIGFTVVVEPQSPSWLNVTAYRILCTRDGAIQWEEYNERGAGGIPTEKLEKAEVFLRGNISWDGCSNWECVPKSGMPVHFCGIEDAERVYKLWQWIYEIASTEIEDWDQ